MNSDDAASPPSYHQGGSTTNMEEKKRRASIQAIMKDPNLNPHERRRSIQYLMDGRRRSSIVCQPSFLTPIGNDMSTTAAYAAEGCDSFPDEEAFEDSASRQNTTAGSDGKGVAKSKRVSACDAADGGHDERHVRVGESFALEFSEMEMKCLDADGDICETTPAPMSSSAKSNALWRRLEESRPTCPHYQRNCSIVSPCCGLVFGCRICHDDYPDLPPPRSRRQIGADDTCTPAVAADSATTKTPLLSQHSTISLPINFDEDEESHHEINRFLISEVICRECFTHQSSKT